MNIRIALLTACALIIATAGGVQAKEFVQAGEASWYGAAFHGQTTASGETYNMYELTAAHKFLPLGSKVRVTNKVNNKSIVVRINDRGPYIKGRVIDLSKAAARELGMHDRGTAPVRIETVDTPAGVTAKGDVQGIFYVHLATFSSHDPAQGLFSRLENGGREPRLLQITDPDGYTAHVQLGPFPALSEANGALEAQSAEFPEAYVMAELEGASLRSYLRANGQKKGADRLAALLQQDDSDDKERQEADLEAPEKLKTAAKGPDKEETEPVEGADAKIAEKAEEPEEASQAAARLPATRLQGLAPCGFPLQAGEEAGFFVQLAMYNLQANAQKLLQGMRPLTDPMRVVRTDVGNRRTYMVQAGPFSTRQEAEQRLEHYRNKLRDAFVLPGARIEPDDSCVLQAMQGEG